MIVTAPKPLEALVASIDALDAETLFLVGCGTCAASVGTGGEDALATAAAEFSQRGYRVVGSAVPESGCSIPGTRATLRAHGSGLAVESTPGEGTAFVVTLPVEAGPARPVPVAF